jgi:hypothetical protein
VNRWPDPYTVTFYAEQVERALRRLIDHARGGGDVREAVARLQAPLPAVEPLGDESLVRLCAEGDPRALTLLFPSPPRQDDLGLETSEFMSRWWSEVRARLGERETAVEESAW